MVIRKRPKPEALFGVLNNDDLSEQAFDDALSIMERELEGHVTRPEENRPNDRGQEPELTPELRDDGFVESRYLDAFPDIADAIAGGEWDSGLDHYLRHGIQEDRLTDLRYLNAGQVKDTPTFPTGDIDAIFVTRSGWCVVIGWMNDDAATLHEISCLKANRFVAAVRYLARCRREDAEGVVVARPGKLLGFWTVFHVKEGFKPADVIQLRLSVGREQKTFSVQPKHVGDEQLREVALEYLASARYFANPQAEAALQLKDGLGEILVDLNVEISKRVIAGAYVSRFRTQTGKLDGSIVVCLYGRSEYLFLQAAMFSGCPGSDRYEFIYVSNSPELAETLLKEAAMAHRIYGLRITIVILPSNAGFGAANNVAAEHALSDRILIVNPDVFPRDRNWATQHSALIANLPPEQTAIFGVPLYYDDGSLMHAGMFFDIDTGVSIRNGEIERHDMIRVEHHAKGAPPDTQAFLASRQVSAVTGAFISVDRAWFESIGGFSLEYVFGHYEDADLCLKSLVAGKPVWVHNVPFWHLEGKGSTRRHVHEGGSTVNRWHFTNLWKDFIESELRGRRPQRLKLS
jgi:GT2 family glycosyltransferase